MQVFTQKNEVAVCTNHHIQRPCPVQINPMTVYGMLKEHNIPKGEFLLQTAATSVLGRQIISLAKHYGVNTINIVRRKEAVDELKSLGYDIVARPCCCLRDFLHLCVYTA